MRFFNFNALVALVFGLLLGFSASITSTVLAEGGKVREGHGSVDSAITEINLLCQQAGAVGGEVTISYTSIAKDGSEVVYVIPCDPPEMDDSDD